jgi:PIN domain nuclease of toxin-antitoxin system
VILIDTQVLVWSALGDQRLGQRCRQELDEAPNLYMSPISAWEIAMLAEKRRFRLGMTISGWVAQAVEVHGVKWAQLTADIAVDAGTLPGQIHGDPADRLIIATARALNCPLLTADRTILDYAAAGHVQGIDARR